MNETIFLDTVGLGSVKGDDEMTKTMQGVIHGKMIELINDPGLADGEQVRVVIESTTPTYQRGERLLRCEGALADDPYWDDIMEEIQQSRKLERRSQEIDL